MMLKPTAEITQLIPPISNNSGENPQMYRWVLRRRRRESVCVDFSWGWSHTEGGRGESILRMFEEATGKHNVMSLLTNTHIHKCVHTLHAVMSRGMMILPTKCHRLMAESNARIPQNNTGHCPWLLPRT